MEENVKSNNKVIIIVMGVIIALLLIVIGVLSFNKFNNKENKEKGNNNQPVENNEKIDNNNQPVENNEKIDNNNQETENNNETVEENQTTENDNQPQTTSSTNDFSYSNFNLKLTNELKNLDNIYAIDEKANLDESYSLYARFTDESSVEIATIQPTNSAIFESRSLDVDNNKLYFIIGSKSKEVYYIDLNNLKGGATKLEDFNKASSGQITTIFVKNNDIYYSSSWHHKLNKYNTQTKKVTTILSEIDWYGYYVDKSHNTIFYNKDNKMYICDLDGNNSTEVDFAMADLLTMAVYKGNPIFPYLRLVSTDDQILDLYEYNYETKSFNKIKENIHDYKVKYNSIEVYTKYNDEFERSFYLNK